MLHRVTYLFWYNRQHRQSQYRGNHSRKSATPPLLVLVCLLQLVAHPIVHNEHHLCYSNLISAATQAATTTFKLKLCNGANRSTFRLHFCCDNDKVVWWYLHLQCCTIDKGKKKWRQQIQLEKNRNKRFLIVKVNLSFGSFENTTTLVSWS